MENPSHIPAILKRVFWLSGSPCGGKTTISNALAERFDWNVYHVDEHWDDHKRRASPSEHPVYYQISRITGDELWLRPLEEQIRTEPAFVSDSFPLILEDILNLLETDSRSLIVDASVTPESVVHLLPDEKHIFYLIPEESFQRHQYARRPLIAPVLAKTSDPDLAFANWQARDAAYARWLEAEVDRFKLSRLLVDGTKSIDATANLVAEHFCS